MIRFSLFGIPVEVQPMFWLTAAFLGGALGADSPKEILGVLLFMFAAFVSILIHELGHASVGRRYAGGRTWITLWAMGGLAHHEGSRFTRSSRFWMLAAGPGAGFVLAGVIAAGILIALPMSDALLLLRFGFFDDGAFSHDPRLFEWYHENTEAFILLRHFLWINLWWGLVNLLPVWPLDGGQIADVFISPRRKVFQIGIVTAIVMAAFGWLGMNSLYVALLFGFLAWQNWQSLKTWQ